MSAPVDGFVSVGKVGDFPEGRGRSVTVGGRAVAVFHLDGEFHALQDACPHMRASLADGRIDGDRVVCHWHGWRFHIATGEGDNRAGKCARVFRVRVIEERVWVEVDPGDSRDDVPDEADEWVSGDPNRFFRS